MANLHPPASFHQGDTWTIDGDLQNPDGTPFDLTGASIMWRLKTPAGADVLACAIGSGITVGDDPTDGLCRIVVTPEQSALIVPGSYRDQLRATSAGGLVSTQWEGEILARKSFFV